MASRNPATGEYFKSVKHPTALMAARGDMKAGYNPTIAKKFLGKAKLYTGSENDPAKIKGKVIAQGDDAIDYLKKAKSKEELKNLSNNRDMGNISRYAKGGKVTMQDKKRADMKPFDNPGNKMYTHNVPEFAVGGIIGAVKSLLGGAKGAVSGVKAAGTATKASKFADKVGKFSEYAQKAQDVAGKVQGAAGEPKTDEEIAAMQARPTYNPQALSQRYAPQQLAQSGTPTTNKLMPKKYRAGTGYFRNTESHAGPQVYQDKTWGVADDIGKAAKFLKLGGTTGKVLGGLLNSSTSGVKKESAEGTATTVGGTENQSPKAPVVTDEEKGVEKAVVETAQTPVSPAAKKQVELNAKGKMEMNEKDVTFPVPGSPAKNDPVQFKTGHLEILKNPKKMKKGTKYVSRLKKRYS